LTGQDNIHFVDHQTGFLTMRHLVLCSTCRFPDGRKTDEHGRTGGRVMIESMRKVLQARNRKDVSIVEQSCLWNCTQSCSVVIRDSERFSYVTCRHVPTEQQAEAILAWFDMHGETETGEVPFREWPDAMRGHFIARIPPVHT
jgi:predicted metal-binding protein